MTNRSLISTQQQGRVRVLQLGGGVAHPLSRAMIGALHAALYDAVADSSVGAIVFHGPGHIFCAGHDLKEIAQHRSDADHGEAYLHDLFEACGALMLDVARCEKPTIAQVEGIATAAGLQLVAACDLAFASQGASVCLPGVNNGGFCTTPAVAVGRTIGRKALMELTLTGQPRDAHWAERAGLFNALLPDADALAAHVDTVAQHIAGFDHPALSSGKAALNAQLELGLEAAYALATRVMVGHFMEPSRLAHEKTQKFAR